MRLKKAKHALFSGAFACLDAFKGLLIRYEILTQNGLSMNILACILRFVLRIDKKVKLT